MLKPILLLILFAFTLYAQQFSEIRDSHFGASAATWANYEGWNNYKELGVHYARLPFDVPKSAMIDNFFFRRYDSIVINGQSNGVIMYGIVNPRKDNNGWNTASEFASKFKSIVERYDGDGINDMAGLTYPIKNWEICNEVMYDSMANNTMSPAYPMWVGFTKTMYLNYMDSTRLALMEACSDCKLFNGAQLLPPSEFFPSIWDLTAAPPNGKGPNIIDAISYHNYSENLEIDKAITDFTLYNLQNKPIWITEAGMQNEYLKNNNLSQDDNARLMVKSFVYAFAKGASKIIYTTIRAQDNDHPSIKWEALCESSNGNKKKVFYSYQQLIKLIDYFTAVTTVSPHNDSTIFAFKFTVNNNFVYILWAKSNQQVSLKLSNPSITQVKVTGSVPIDEKGTFFTTDLDATNGTVSLNLSNEAIIVIENIPVLNKNKEPSKTDFYFRKIGDKIVMSLPKSMNVNIEFFNLKGQNVYSINQKKQNLSIDTKKVGHGFYFVRIKSNYGIYNSKIFNY